ncbi:MAG: helix-turn-helix transcriptional regulator [Oscillospiraceae bacterium]|nr:helix-turn-helix transcriptional regulator [Oscillospiraceae bacterium]
MISNLNQLSFQSYGTIESERVRGRDLAQKAEHRQVRELTRGECPVLVSQSAVWLCNHSNMTVLSVAAEGDSFQHFYLDKMVCIKPGIRFALHPYQERSSVELASSQELREVDHLCAGDEFRLRRQIQVSSIYTFFYQEKEKGFTFPGEEHAPLELTYVDKGTLHSVADGRDILLEQGDLVIYAPGQWHMQYADVDMSPSFITITFDLAGDYPSELINRKFTIPQSAVPALQRMLRELDRMDAYSADIVICMLQLLLLELLREQTTPAGTKLRTTNAVNSENEIIRRAQQYISEHVREKLTVPLVARHVDVSPSYLTALFRKNLQISPGEYVRRIKLQESKQMIREDNMNFTEIAAALQYSTVHHFSRQFKDKFGITPTEYAKSVR